MPRNARILAGALVLVLLVAGTVFAARSNPGDHPPFPAAASHEPKSSDDANETGAPLTDDHAAQLIDLLKTAGIDGVTAAELKTLASKYGVGGAVRLEAWAKASGKSVSDLAAMFDGGMGWGEIAHQLNGADTSLNLSPGIGWIMSGGHGHGHGADTSTKAKAKHQEPEASSSPS